MSYYFLEEVIISALAHISKQKDETEKKPIYGVFIIESMDIENELKENFDGWALKTILDLCGIENQYFVTIQELKNQKYIKKKYH